jgi:predicted PurR-regulated permease PerM
MNNEEQNQVKAHTKITIGLVLSWGLGVLAAISGVTLLFSQLLTGILMLLLAAVLLPPVNKFVADKLHFSISGGLKFVVVIILLGVIGATMSTDSTSNSNTSTVPSTEQANNTKAEDNSVPREYKSALNKAASYADTMHMSKQGVYDQLVSEYGEKFSTAAAQYAIDNVKADWNANALAKAKSYQDTMNMSPAGIHDQLTSANGEKFTQSEADYAIQHLND